MERILKGWNFMRALRLVLGLYIAVQSVTTGEWMLGIAGLFLSGTALMNIGCCGVNGCQPIVRSNPDPKKEIIYEEVDV
jgi:hypothetical protein